jgi:hypothetical protein
MTGATYETLIYHQKQALLTWKTALQAAVTSLNPEIETAAWELLVLCADNLTKPSIDTDEEISRVAHDLAATVLEKSDIRTLNLSYRDGLLEAVLRHTTAGEETTCRMVHFANLLSDAFRDAYADRLRRMISHQRTTRLSEELQLAKRIQQRLLPKMIPTIPGVQVAGRVVPAAEVGGDYWSVKYYRDDGVVTIKLADISGHGIAAATLVAAVKFISGGYYRGSKSAHEVVEHTNRILVLETPVEVLVTMVYGWLYPETKEIDIVNAGHEPVFLCEDGVCTDIPPTGPVLGVADTTYGEQRLSLSPGGILFFCSDGITDAGIGEPFGIARVKELVLANRNRSADEIAELVIQSVTDYAGQPHDDMSLVAVKAVDEDSA